MSAKTVAIAKALAWEWLIEGDDDARSSWMEKAAAVEAIATIEGTARVLCKMNQNCFDAAGKELCLALSDCRDWRSFEVMAIAACAAQIA